jgi:chemosensory pili system protein ChpC
MTTLADELYCLLVPLAGERLLLPRGCVAEVVAYQTPQELTGAPPWLLGLVAWNGRQVPLLSFEGCRGEDVPPPTSRARLVILHAADVGIESGCLALVAQGFPQLLRASRELIRADESSQYASDDPVLARLQLLNEGALVPDLPLLEAKVAAEIRNGLLR